MLWEDMMEPLDIVLPLLNVTIQKLTPGRLSVRCRVDVVVQVTKNFIVRARGY